MTEHPRDRSKLLAVLEHVLLEVPQTPARGEEVMAALAEHDGETIEAINVAIKAIQTLES